MDWLAKQAGQCLEADYPYTSGGAGANGKCKTTCTPAAKIIKGVELPAKNQTVLEQAIAMVPLSLSVDASANWWQLYAGGIVTRACRCSGDACLDHGVGGVGYGEDSATGEQYW